MRSSYLDYAMSVIVARALPDARDGLKPVHRRILYAMHDMGLQPNSSYKKSARIVGEVLGKYHPHGDSAVYDAMARMAQELQSDDIRWWTARETSAPVDGDSPAAMRYTEAKLGQHCGTHAARYRPGYCRLGYELRRQPAGAEWYSRPCCRTCCSTVPAALPWVWRPTFHRTT